MTDTLLRFRPQFPILEKSTYLVSNSLGAMPAGVPDRLAEYADAWATHGVRAWAKGWWEMPVEVGNEIAPLLGAGTDEVAMQPNVSVAQAVVLSAIEFTPERNKVVMTELDFPSVRYVMEALVQKFGGRIVVVPTDDGITIDDQRLLDAIDHETALVSVSHVLFRSAYILDAAAICQKAHDVGALVSLDAFHSVGVMPVDVKAIGADFLTGGVLKWLCGGPGGCYLYVDPDVSARLAPALTGWQAHSRPFAFENEMEYTGGAERWLGGTPSIPALYAATEGPRIIRSAGIEAIRAKSIHQTGRLVEMAQLREFTVNAPLDSARRAGTVAIDMPNSWEISRHLLARDMLIDYRPAAGIRIAPHFYTSDEELDAVMAEIDEVRTSGAWRAYEGQQSIVT